MSQRTRVVAFMGITFAVMLPYFGFVLYCSVRLPQNNWPLWATNTLLIWFIANFVVLMFVAKKFLKASPVGAQDVVQAGARTRFGIWQLRSAALVIIWSGLFLYGVKGTIEGKYALNRALPAGAFLLFFIGLFGWNLYRSSRSSR
jgi:hypothetical protein